MEVRKDDGRPVTSLDGSALPRTTPRFNRPRKEVHFRVPIDGFAGPSLNWSLARSLARSDARVESNFARAGLAAGTPPRYGEAVGLLVLSHDRLP
jgi:hypothetical protein